MGNDAEPSGLDVADDYSQLVFDALAQLRPGQRVRLALVAGRA